jgi:hypothetical protein
VLELDPNGEAMETKKIEIFINQWDAHSELTAMYTFLENNAFTLS